MQPMPLGAQVHDQVKEYYGKVLQSSSDLKTDACCPTDALPEYLKPYVARIADEVVERYYGCGSPIPPALDGMTVLDLGCGTGRDVYLASQLVGEAGRVIGIDMTEEQLAVARTHQEAQAERFGHSASNVRFVQGYLEDLAAAGIADASVDVVISNCVLNLSPRKKQVFSEILRVLKPGGELYFADVFTDRRLPEEVQNDPVLVGECLGGAMYTEDFRRGMEGLGVPDFRVVSSRELAKDDAALFERTGAARFFSMTVRAFKLDSLEDRCEDYGQVAWYRGTMPHHPYTFTLDDHHVFETDKPMLVCGNTAAMVGETRFAPHFRLEGDRSKHFGLFDCAPTGASGVDTAPGACC